LEGVGMVEDKHGWSLNDVGTHASCKTTQGNTVQQ
jgi:hypothetical protein